MKFNPKTPSIMLKLGAPKRRPAPLDLALGRADFVHLDPFLCFGEGGDGGGSGGGDGGGERTFTQSDVDKIIGDRLRSRDKELATMRDQLEASGSKYKALEQQLAELQESKSKKGEGPDLEKLQRDMKGLGAQLEEATKAKATAEAQAAQTQARYEQYRIRQAAVSALAAKGALSSGLQDATMLFAATGEYEAVEQDGKVTEVVRFRIGDVPYDDPAEAAEKFLAAKPHFLKSGSGSGSKKTQGGLIGDGRLDHMTVDQMLSEGLATPSPGSKQR